LKRMRCSWLTLLPGAGVETVKLDQQARPLPAAVIVVRLFV